MHVLLQIRLWYFETLWYSETQLYKANFIVPLAYNYHNTQSVNQSNKQTNPNRSYQIINHLDSDLKMNSEEYQEIIQFLREQKYPDTVQDSRQTRWNYKGKLSSYFITECDTLFKVRFYLYPENDSFILINNPIIYILIKIQWILFNSQRLPVHNGHFGQSFPCCYYLTGSIVFDFIILIIFFLRS